MAADTEKGRGAGLRKPPSEAARTHEELFDVITDGSIESTQVTLDIITDRCEHAGTKSHQICRGQDVGPGFLA